MAHPQGGTGSRASAFQFSAEPYWALGSQPRSYFAYELQPGHKILDQVVVLNKSSSPESFVVYGEDATNVAGTGGYAYEARNKVHNTTVGLWLTIGTPAFTVPPGKEVVDTFQLAIPANAPPGDHVGGVVVQEVNKTPRLKRPVGLNLVLRIAVPVYVHVVGRLFPSLTIADLAVIHTSPVFPYLSGSAKVAVRFDLVNSGNDILDPRSVTVSITGLLGGTIHAYTVHQVPTAPQSRANPLPVQMLPGGSLTLTEVWSGLPPFDPLTAHVSATANDPTTGLPYSTSTSTMFWYFPWIIILILLALIALVIARIVQVRRRRAAGEGPDRGPGGAVSVSPSGGPESAALEEAGV